MITDDGDKDRRVCRASTVTWWKELETSAFLALIQQNHNSTPAYNVNSGLQGLRLSPTTTRSRRRPRSSRLQRRPAEEGRRLARGLSPRPRPVRSRPRPPKCCRIYEG